MSIPKLNWPGASGQAEEGSGCWGHPPPRDAWRRRRAGGAERGGISARPCWSQGGSAGEEGWRGAKTRSFPEPKCCKEPLSLWAGTASSPPAPARPQSCGEEQQSPGAVGAAGRECTTLLRDSRKKPQPRSGECCARISPSPGVAFPGTQASPTSRRGAPTLAHLYSRRSSRLGSASVSRSVSHPARSITRVQPHVPAGTAPGPPLIAASPLSPIQRGIHEHHSLLFNGEASRTLALTNSTQKISPGERRVRWPGRPPRPYSQVGAKAPSHRRGAAKPTTSGQVFCRI